MPSSVGAGRTRTALWVLFGLAIVLAVIDGGSCAIARIQVDEDGKTAARYAVQQITGQPVNTQTALAAYDAAASALPNANEHVVADNFTVHADGSITMTVTRKAPTLVFKYVPKLKDLTVAKVTHTQQPLGS